MKTIPKYIINLQHYTDNSQQSSEQ